MAQELDLYKEIIENLHLEKRNAAALSPLALAFIGDAVYEIILRSKVISDFDRSVNDLNRLSSVIAKAPSQCEIANKLLDENMLNEEELVIYKRGRNAKSNTVAKNASVREYRVATGLEALIGYLYVDGQTNRALELLNYGFDYLIDKHSGEKI